MTTIVTGASGWLGQALVAALHHDGRQVRVLVPEAADTLKVRALAPEADVVIGDVRDPVTVDRLFADTERPSVLHTAAVIHPQKTTREFFDVNVGGTALMLDRARRFGVGRFVHVSSNSAFGSRRSPTDVFDETTPYDPHLGYGQSKMEAELLVRRAVEQRGVDAVIVRAPWFYGPFQPERQTQFFRAIRKGAFPLIGDGTNRRSMAYVDNLVQGVLRAERRAGIAGNAYWIADATPYAMSEILDAVKAALTAEGLTVADRQVKLPGVVAEMAGAADRLIQRSGRYVQSVHVLSEMNKTIACTIDKARAELGYEPEVELREGMRRSVRWCLDRGFAL